jgi:hypothetical protein
MSSAPMDNKQQKAMRKKPKCVFCLKYTGLNLYYVCRAAYYCNQQCQRKHWPEHSKVCSHTLPIVYNQDLQRQQTKSVRKQVSMEAIDCVSQTVTYRIGIDTTLFTASFEDFKRGNMHKKQAA